MTHVRAHDLMFDRWVVGQALTRSTGAPIGLEQVVVAGRYRLDAQIGQGAHGRVYLAHDIDLGRDMALKTCSPRDTIEARALARVSCRGVVTLHDQGIDGETRWLALEHIDGPTLGDWLAGRGTRETVRVFIALARTLATVHHAGIVHRDVKPANIIVRDGRPVLLDFGLAIIEGGPASRGLGTPLYAAPEQIQGMPVDARADQFSFCVALWEALTGENPYPGRTTYARLAATDRGPHDPAPPTSLARILRRGLDPKPDNRWPDMEALAQALQDAQAARVRRPRALALGLAAAAVFGVCARSGGAEAVAGDMDAELDPLAIPSLALSAAEAGDAATSLDLLERASRAAVTEVERRALARTAEQVGAELHRRGLLDPAGHAYGVAQTLWLQSSDPVNATRALDRVRSTVR